MFTRQIGEKTMIITLSGVAGAGKSFYKNEIVKNLKIENLVIYTTREKRENEVEGIDKYFTTKDEINKKLENGSIFTAYELLGVTYAYSSMYKDPSINSVTELHYEWIKDFKKKAENVHSIYIIPNNIEIVKEQIRKRNWSEEMCKKRLQEIQDYKQKIKEDKEFRDAFDEVFYNNYDEESLKEMLKLVKKVLSIGG